ncbi:MAG: type IV pilus modification protein PilV [Pseudomonadota bacterium]
MLPATKPLKPQTMRRQQGFSLIEALIAGVILAIGILGIVSLLAMSKASQHEGIQRVRAVSLADDILERIRRNPSAMATYDIGLNAPLGSKPTPPTEPSPNCTTATCDFEQLALHDLWTWEQLLDGASATITDAGGSTVRTAAMRNVQACIEFSADTGKNNTGTVDVVLQWDSLQESTDGVDPAGTRCGSATAENLARRQLIVSSYVVDETEL